MVNRSAKEQCLQNLNSNLVTSYFLGSKQYAKKLIQNFISILIELIDDYMHN